VKRANAKDFAMGFMLIAKPRWLKRKLSREVEEARKKLSKFRLEVAGKEKIVNETATLERIVEIEPEIGRVFDELCSVPKHLRWSRFVEANGTTPKAYLMQSVGFRVRNPKLWSQAAYRVVMEHKWDATLSA
jgi:hypothetical protein